MSYTPPELPLAANFNSSGYSAPSVGTLTFSFGTTTIVQTGTYVPPSDTSLNFSLKAGAPGTLPIAAKFHETDQIEFTLVIPAKAPALRVSAVYNRSSWEAIRDGKVDLNFVKHQTVRDPKNLPLNFQQDPDFIWPTLGKMHMLSAKPKLSMKARFIPLPESATIHLKQPRFSMHVEETYLGYAIRTTRLHIRSSSPKMAVQASYLGIPPRFAAFAGASQQPRMDMGMYYDNRVHRFDVMLDHLHNWKLTQQAISRRAGESWREALEFFQHYDHEWGEAKRLGYIDTINFQEMLPANFFTADHWTLAVEWTIRNSAVFDSVIHLHHWNEGVWTEAKPTGVAAGKFTFQNGVPFFSYFKGWWQVSKHSLGKMVGSDFNDRGLPLAVRYFLPWEEGVYVRPDFKKWEKPPLPPEPPPPLPNPEPGRPNALNFQCALELGPMRYKEWQYSKLAGSYTEPKVDNVVFDFQPTGYAPQSLGINAAMAFGLNLWVERVELGRSFARPLNVKLNFGKNPCGKTDEERGIPVMRVYLVINSLSLKRVDDNSPIQIFNANIGIDKDSWAWRFSGDISTFDIDKITPDANGPVEVELTINTYKWRFLIESYEEDRVFGQVSVKVSGRSVTAFLDSPYAPTRTMVYSSEIRSRQAADNELQRPGLVTGFDVDWQIATDQDPNGWLIPGGALTYQGLSPIQVINRIAAATGGYVNSHPYLRTLHMKSGYSIPSWKWNDITTTPDIVIPKSIVTKQALKWSEEPAYDGLYVSGENYGVTAFVSKAGTIGSNQREMVVDPLITDYISARERGIVELSKGGRAASVTLDLPLTSNLAGLVLPGTLAEIDPAGLARDAIWRGMVRATNITAQWGNTLEVNQSIELERHY